MLVYFWLGLGPLHILKGGLHWDLYFLAFYLPQKMFCIWVAFLKCLKNLPQAIASFTEIYIVMKWGEDRYLGQLIVAYYPEIRASIYSHKDKLVEWKANTYTKLQIQLLGKV